MKLFQSLVLPLLLFFALTLFSGCGGTKMESIWLDREAVIDGKDLEWDGARVILEDANLGMGLMNDAENFYLTLSLTNRMVQRQVLRSGFTIWFDSQGGKKKVFGIRFPLGMRESAGQRGEAAPGMDPEGMGGRMGDMGDRGPLDPRQLEALFDRLIEKGELEILGSEKTPLRRYTLIENQEVQLGITFENGRLVYELKVPLAKADDLSLGIGTVPGKTFGLGFETSELDMAAMRQQMAGKRGRGMGGAMDDELGVGGGGGAGMRGSRRGGMRSGMMRTAERFQLWTRVKLAPMAER